MPTVENTYVVNIGDVLSAWTNGRYRSALHRVINKSALSDRYSIPFFYDGTMTARMSSLDKESGTKQEAMKTVGQHFRERWTAADIKT